MAAMAVNGPSKLRLGRQPMHRGWRMSDAQVKLEEYRQQANDRSMQLRTSTNVAGAWSEDVAPIAGMGPAGVALLGATN
jgi:hypothetical protein